MTDARAEAAMNRVCGNFLPLSAYAGQGYNIAALRKCKDVEEHPVLGATYNVDLKSVTTDDVRKKVWADLFNQSGEQKQKAQKKKDNKKQNLPRRRRTMNAHRRIAVRPPFYQR